MLNRPRSPTNPDVDRLRHLKMKIKSWEKDFAAKNGGKLPTRSDISANIKMASRYSEYQKLKKQPRQEKHQASTYISPSQLIQENRAQTPQKSAIRPSHTPIKPPLNPLFTPTNRPELQGSLFSPSASAVRRLRWMSKGYVSPTPQKNGKVIGLFDKLPGTTPTPPKRQQRDECDAFLTRLTDSEKNSKIICNSCLEDSDDEDTYVPLDPTTPSRKRRYQFQTPISKKNKASSNEKDLFPTPAIFRQHSHTVELKENGSPVTPEIKRFLPNGGIIGKVKPLSTLVRELREMQDEEDPGLEALRELEQNDLNPGHLDPAQEDGLTNPSALVDRFCPTTVFTPLEETGSNDPTREPNYRKRGQKRQTKRVKIRPVRASKTKIATEELDGAGSEFGLDSGEKSGASGQKKEVDEDEDELPDELSEDELAVIITKQPTQATKELPFRTTKRSTVKADKHANYTRMKMHHKGRKGFRSKGKGKR